MERWFLQPGRGPDGSKIAPRRGSRQAAVLTRRPLLGVETDAGSQESWRTGAFCLAFLPYGNGGVLLTLDFSQKGRTPRTSEFIQRYNARFAKAPLSDHDAHRPVRDDEDLERIFTWQADRKISIRCSRLVRAVHVRYGIGWGTKGTGCVFGWI